MGTPWWVTLGVALGSALLGGGGLAALLTWRTQSRSAARHDTVEERRVTIEERRVDLEKAESTNRILADALRWYESECGRLRARVTELEAAARA